MYLYVYQEWGKNQPGLEEVWFQTMEENPLPELLFVCLFVCFSPSLTESLRHKSLPGAYCKEQEQTNTPCLCLALFHMGFLFTWLLWVLSIWNNSPFFSSLLGWVNNTEQTPNCSYSTERTSSSVLGVRDPAAAMAEPGTQTGLEGIFLGLCVPCSPGGRCPPPQKDWGSPALRRAPRNL